MRLDTKTTAVALIVMRASQRRSANHGTPCGGSGDIGRRNQPRSFTGTQTASDPGCHR